jgi:ribosomal protein S15P/S13E
MAKGRDSRPTRAKQTARSINNKTNQLKDHLERFPEDKNAKDKLEKITRSGNSQKRVNVHPTEKVLARFADGNVRRDAKRGR